MMEILTEMVNEHPNFVIAKSLNNMRKQVEAHPEPCQTS